MNGYVCIWNGKRLELYAESAYAAQQMAQKAFQSDTRKKVKSWDISVVLCELDGQIVTHNGAEL